MNTQYDDSQKEIVLNQLIIDMGNARKYLSIKDMAQVIAKSYDDIEIEVLQDEISNITTNDIQNAKQD